MISRLELSNISKSLRHIRNGNLFLLKVESTFSFMEFVETFMALFTTETARNGYFYTLNSKIGATRDNFFTILTFNQVFLDMELFHAFTIFGL